MKSKALSCRQLQKKWLGEVKCTLMMYICSIISLFLLSGRWFLDLIQFKPLNAITGLCYRLHNVITFKTSQLISIIKSLVIIISRLFLSVGYFYHFWSLSKWSHSATSIVACIFSLVDTPNFDATLWELPSGSSSTSLWQRFDLPNWNWNIIWLATKST